MLHTAFLSAIALIAFFDLPVEIKIGAIAGPSVAALVAAAFAIRGYSLTETHIEIVRWAGTLKLPIEGLLAAEGKAEAATRATRLFGHGLLSFVGWYRNKEIGFFYAHATDFSRAVLLRYADKKIVITPHDPQQFLMRLRTFMSVAPAWRGN